MARYYKQISSEQVTDMTESKKKDSQNMDVQIKDIKNESTKAERAEKRWSVFIITLFPCLWQEEA